MATKNLKAIADKYTYRIPWSDEDGEHVGLCAEFPSLSWLDPSADEAWKGIRKLVINVIEDMQSSHETLPEPLSTRNYSGKLIVRIPPAVHRRLAIEAHESQISLN